MLNSRANPEDDRAAPAERRAAARVRRLQRMADFGVSIGEKLERQAELAAAYAEAEAVPDNLPHSRRLDEIARSFAQVSRAVSLATALEDRLDNGLPALPAEDWAAKQKRAEVAKAVVRAIDADPTVLTHRRAVDLRLRLDRLLDAELADLDAFLQRPLEQIVARIEKDLGLEDLNPPPAAAAAGGGGPPNGGGGGFRAPSDSGAASARWPQMLDGEFPISHAPQPQLRCGVLRDDRQIVGDRIRPVESGPALITPPPLRGPPPPRVPREGG